MADITNTVMRSNGINQESLIHQDAVVLDFKANASGATTTGSHEFFTLPAGHAFLGVTMVFLESLTSAGTATLNLSLSAGSTSKDLLSSLSLSQMAAGCVYQANAPTSSSVMYNSTDADAVIKLTVGGAALTGGRILFIINSVPAKSYIENG